MKLSDDPIQYSSRVTGRVVDRFTAAVSGIAFWIGIVAPLSYLMVLVPGFKTEGKFTLLVTLIAVHYVALVLGHPHYRSDS